MSTFELIEARGRVAELEAQVAALTPDAERFRAIHRGRIKTFGWTKVVDHFGAEFWPEPTKGRWPSGTDQQMIDDNDAAEANGRDILLCYADKCRGVRQDPAALKRIKKYTADGVARYRARIAAEEATKIVTETSDA